jgi:hypothetical protein
MEKLMGSLYTFLRRLFWRRWQPKLSKLSRHFFFDLVRELSDMLDDERIQVYYLQISLKWKCFHRILMWYSAKLKVNMSPQWTC